VNDIIRTPYDCWAERRWTPGPNEVAHYREQQEQARVATHRVAWSADARPGGGYFAQILVGDRWVTCYPGRPAGSHADATLDCKLHARESGMGSCRLYPLIANLTPGRAEYDRPMPN